MYFSTESPKFEILTIFVGLSVTWQALVLEVSIFNMSLRISFICIFGTQKVGLRSLL